MSNDTERLLGEIECGTAADLAMLVRYNTFPPGPTYLRPLDELILAGRPHPGQSTMMRGDLIECVGGSGSGKTTFITHLVFTTILSSHIPDFLSTPLGGKELQATMIIPRSHNLSRIIRNLRMSIRNHVLGISPAIAQKMLDRITQESLARLTVYRVKSRWKDLALVLKRILDGISNLPRGNASTGGAMDLLIIEGIGDAYYPTRWIEEQRGYNVNKSALSSYGGRKIVGADEVGLRHVMDCIDWIRREVGSVVVMTNQGLRPSKESSSFFHSHLPHPYPSPYSNPTLPNSVSPSSSTPHWGLTMQITFNGRVQRGLQYPAETILSDVLQQQLNAKRQLQKEGRSETGIYECAVRMIDTSTGAVSTRVGGRFRFGVERGILFDISGEA
uniref:DNA recombination and repair protein Rad51-like C-terminal domain-containing protein n=1 Tax=Kwoniella dejecticola CBS 10117 TaxID=1296121 RepID=A0A1A6A4Q6_9TREE|nr:uncharacterized protein I303_04360 [Kwoniella dejecticola CBS 10117]OBR85033.1 hypothetical protein I303_04360 [Kwoniella dejecticola CBS 10117]